MMTEITEKEKKSDKSTTYRPDASKCQRGAAYCSTRIILQIAESKKNRRDSKKVRKLEQLSFCCVAYKDMYALQY
jgi:hypothetical protein